MSARPIAYVALGLYRYFASAVDYVFVFQRCRDHLSCITAFEMDVAIKIIRFIMIACRGHLMHSIGVFAWATIAQGSRVRLGGATHGPRGHFVWINFEVSKRFVL